MPKASNNDVPSKEFNTISIQYNFKNETIDVPSTELLFLN